MERFELTQKSAQSSHNAVAGLQKMRTDIAQQFMERHIHQQEHFVMCSTVQHLALSQRCVGAAAGDEEQEQFADQPWYIRGSSL